jgi:hypothetical protein
MSFWSASTKTQRLGVRKLHNTRSSQNVVSKTMAVSVHLVTLLDAFSIKPVRSAEEFRGK